TRVRSLRLPLAGFNVFKRTSSFLHAHEVLDLADHPAVLGRVRDDYGLVAAPQAEAREAFRVPRRPAEPALQQRHLDPLLLGHDSPQATISSSDLPRFAAITCGERIFVNAFIVARTTLIGLREP